MVPDSGSVIAHFPALAGRGASAYQEARCLLWMGERRGCLAACEAGDGMRPAIARAGPIGLSTAIALARPGHQVAVIDSDGGWAYRRLRRDPARKERRT
jgi:hypothetical protein